MVWAKQDIKQKQEHKSINNCFVSPINGRTTMRAFNKNLRFHGKNAMKVEHLRGPPHPPPWLPTIPKLQFFKISNNHHPRRINSSWWVQPLVKNMIVKMGSSSPNRAKRNKNWNHQPEIYLGRVNPRKLQHTPGAHPRQSPYPNCERIPFTTYW